MASKTTRKISQTGGKAPQRVRAPRSTRRTDAIRPTKEELFVNAFRSSPHPIGITELETGRCLDINDACLTLFGFRRDEVIGQTTLMLGIWPDPQERVRFVERMKSEGAVRNYEVSMRVKSGDLRQFLISSEVITCNGKHCLVTTGNDITERKQAEEALRRAQTELERRVAVRTAELTRANELLQAEITERKRMEETVKEREAITGAFLDNSATVAWMKDEEGRYVYVSPSFERRFHAHLDDWRRKTDFELWPQDVAMEFRENDLAVLKENRVIEVVEQAHEPDGQRSWWLSHKFPYRDTSGKRYVGGLAVEITARKKAEEAVAERARLSALAAEVSLSLNREKPLSEILQHFCDSLTQGLDAAYTRIWVLGPGDLCAECHEADWCKDRTQCLHLQVSAGLSTNLNGEFRRVPLGLLNIGRIAEGAGAMVTNNILHDDRLPDKKWIKENGLQSFAGFPLVVEGRRFGVLALFGRTAFSQEALQTIESLRHGLAMAIARKQAKKTLRRSQQELRRYQAQLQDLTAKLLAAQEGERQRIARDLHDDVSQRLAALVLDVVSLEQRPPVLPELVPAALEPVREQLEQLSDDIHNLAYALHPSLLQHAGLQPAIEDHIHHVTARTGLRITLQAGEIPGSLPLDQSTCLFRVLQESLRNVVKHAHATEITVRLRGSSNGIGLSVTDNGKGFDAIDQSAHQRGLGLVSMQERLRLLQGFLRVRSSPADGTQVCAWIPFTEDKS